MKSPLLLITLSLALLQSAFAAELGVTADSIKIGVSLPLAGPMQVDGTSRRAGMEVVVNRINASGGIHGRKLEILFADDGYEPQNTVRNTKKFITEDKVFALANYLGSPTTKATLPIVSSEHVPLFAPVTGGVFTRMPVIPEVFNVRAGYNEEGAEMVNVLVGKLKLSRIGMVIQDDALGAAGLGAVGKAMSERNLKLAAQASFRRNTEDLKRAIDSLKSAKVQAVIFWGTLKPSIEFIKQARASGIDARFVVASPTSSPEFIDQIGDAGEGMILTQVVPSWTDTSYPVVAQFIRDMKSAHKNAINPYALESYVNTLALAEALKRAGKDLTRGSFRKAVEAMSGVELGGLKLAFSVSDHQGLHRIFAYQLQNGKLVELE